MGIMESQLLRGYYQPNVTVSFWSPFAVTVAVSHGHANSIAAKHGSLFPKGESMHHKHSKRQSTQMTIVLVFMIISLLAGILIPLLAYASLVGI